MIIKSILYKLYKKLLVYGRLRPLKIVLCPNIPNNKKGGLIARLLAVIDNN